MPESKSLKSNRERQRRATVKLDLTTFLVHSLKFKRYQAKKKGIPFDLDEEWVLQQPKMCAITGKKFEIPAEGLGPLTPSFDQKIAGLGYTKENTQLICFWLNAAKGQWSEADIRALIREAALVV